MRRRAKEIPIRAGEKLDHYLIENLVARSLPFSRSSLTDPRYNLEFGQSFIEQMRRSPSTGGQLPRMMAAYNAGPTPVARWAYIPDRGDPLVWIESIPYWETRYYVPAVLRNMWVYQGLNDEQTVRSAIGEVRRKSSPSRTDASSLYRMV